MEVRLPSFLSLVHMPWNDILGNEGSHALDETKVSNCFALVQLGSRNWAFKEQWESGVFLDDALGGDLLCEKCAAERGASLQ